MPTGRDTGLWRGLSLAIVPESLRQTAATLTGAGAKMMKKAAWKDRQARYRRRVQSRGTKPKSRNRARAAADDRAV